jgi:peptide deformylase
MSATYLKFPVDSYDLSAEDIKRFTEELALGMVPVDHPALTQTAAAVAELDISTPRIREVISSLITVARGQQRGRKSDKIKRMLVGLAAPQVGKSLRIIVVDTQVTRDRKHNGKLECFINPEIIWRSRETEEGREGCFSAGPVWGLVRRPIAVKICATTPDGMRIERIFENFTARIIQHEIDHLDGIRFPDRINSDRKRHWVHSEELATYPAYITHWPRHCTLERWQAFKQGRPHAG